MLSQGRELMRELAALRHRERRGDADVMQMPAVVVEAEEQRADQFVFAVLVPAESGDDAVRRAGVLDLDHRALPRLVMAVSGLRNDAIQSGAFDVIEPLPRQ